MTLTREEFDRLAEEVVSLHPRPAVTAAQWADAQARHWPGTRDEYAAWRHYKDAADAFGDDTDSPAACAAYDRLDVLRAIQAVAARDRAGADS